MDEAKTFWIVLKWNGEDEPKPLTAHYSEAKARGWASEAILDCEDGEFLTIAQTVPQVVLPASMEDLGWKPA